MAIGDADAKVTRALARKSDPQSAAALVQELYPLEDHVADLVALARTSKDRRVRLRASQVLAKLRGGEEPAAQQQGVGLRFASFLTGASRVDAVQGGDASAPGQQDVTPSAHQRHRPRTRAEAKAAAAAARAAQD